MDQITLCVTPLSLIHRTEGGTELGRAVATGFFWRTNSSWYLITNWHNVTGLNPDTLAHLGTFTPNAFEISLKYNRAPFAGGRMIANQTHVFDLYSGDSPIWLEHAERQRIDCVAIPLVIPLEGEFAGKALNELDLTTQYVPAVGDECFVVGYPLGLTAPGRTPIWKRASIATEPELDHDGRPIVLVDTATRQGMSGSPVVARHHGVYAPGGILNDESIIGTVENILGVYSGRIGDDELGGQLGRVWKANIIGEIILGGTPGIHPHNLVYPI